jgi:hypothetical protein
MLNGFRLIIDSWAINGSWNLYQLKKSRQVRPDSGGQWFLEPFSIPHWYQ